MRFNSDLIREILIAVSESLIPDEYGYVEQVYPLDLVKTKLSNYPQNEVLYWIRQLMQSGILVKGRTYVTDLIPHIKDLSLSGYQFVENVSKPSIWKEIRPQLIGMMVSNIPTFIQSAIKLGSIAIAKYSDIHN